MDPDKTYAQQAYRYRRRYFNPVKGMLTPKREEALVGGDRPEESPYLYDEEIILAVNTALAANRPLLVAGPAGTGKSALAASIAAQKKWKFVPTVVTARTEGQDLKWRYDTVKRLRDAHLAAATTASGAPAGVRADADEGERYIRRGVLWKAFALSQQGIGSVVLIDEIDKADSDVPNSLLDVLGSGEFTVDETRDAFTVAVNGAAPPLVVITTNDERELPRPFRRRCVTLTLSPPGRERLLDIARSWNLASGDDAVLAEALAAEVEELGRSSGGDGRFTANAAEYLDALRACLNLKIELGGAEWQAVKRATLLKTLDPIARSR